MASCDDITPVEMRGKSSALRNREQFPARKSSLFKTGLRKTSSVSFGENKMIEIEKRESISVEDKENDDKLRKIREGKHGDDEDEDVPITYSRRWTDSLKIKRKKKKPENVVDKDTENENDRADDRDSEQDVMRDNTDDICELFEKINK
eukprot:GFUD01051971.1.p1 GENE.GFUD01051971.1~~GFUD01051971.1.p1  ORF type:complete len:149 (+),score=65.97 GFUD01051971.1:96-542(+)